MDRGIRSFFETQPLHVRISFNNPQTSFTFPTRWITLPPELVNNVLRELVAYSCAHDSKLPIYVKQGLANASVVCRKWEEATRLPLYNKLVLRSPEDVNELIQIVCARPELCNFTDTITYRRLNDRIPPWIRLRTLLMHVHSHTRLDIEVGKEHSLRDMVDGRTLLHALPRTLPPAAMPPVHSLEVDSTLFQNAVDLSKLIYAFPNDSTMRFKNHLFCSSTSRHTVVRPPYARTQPNVSHVWKNTYSDDTTFADLLSRTPLQLVLMVSDDTCQLVKSILTAFIGVLKPSSLRLFTLEAGTSTVQSGASRVQLNYVFYELIRFRRSNVLAFCPTVGGLPILSF